MKTGSTDVRKERIHNQQIGESFLPNLSESRTEELVMLANEKAVDLSLAAFKGSLLINGGAAIAVLGFAASVITGNEGFSLLVGGISQALMYFAWGVATSVAAIGMAYFSVYFFSAAFADHYEFHRSLIFGRTTHVLALALLVASIGLFVVGTLEVKEAFSAFSSQVELKP